MTASENDNGNKSLIIAFIISITILVFLFSCGARKVEKSEIVEQEKKEVKSTLETETKVTDNTKIIDTSTSDEIEFLPIDNTLSFTIKGQEYKNVKIKHSKKKNNISIDKDIKVSQIEKKEVKTNESKDKETVEKKIERKANYWWLFWFLLLIPIYYLYKKIK